MYKKKAQGPETLRLFLLVLASELHTPKQDGMTAYAFFV